MAMVGVVVAGGDGALGSDLVFEPVVCGGKSPGLSMSTELADVGGCKGCA